MKKNEHEYKRETDEHEHTRTHTHMHRPFRHTLEKYLWQHQTHSTDEQTLLTGKEHNKIKWKLDRIVIQAGS